MNFLKITFFLVFSFVSVTYCFAQKKEKILIVGSDQSTSQNLHRKINHSFEVQYVDASNPNSIDIKESRLMLLLGGEVLSPALRLPIHRFLKAGGNIIAIGPEAFNYVPQPLNPVILSTLQNDYEVVYPVRKGATVLAETPTISDISVGNEKGVQLASKKMGMKDVMLRMSLKGKSSDKRSVLVFKAKGSHFMDLMALEATDTQGKKWYSFAPLERDWQDYQISFADFIPAGWSDGDSPYPLLNPGQIDSIAIGLNSRTVWNEKALDFSVSGIKLAENKRAYTPTSLMQTLAYPFRAIGITYPKWVYDPFYGDAPNNNRINIKNSGEYFSSTPFKQQVSQFWHVSSVVREHPVSQMGTDTKSSYDNKLNRLARPIKIMEEDGTGNAVAEFVQYGGGQYKNASVAMFGLNPNEVMNNEGFLDYVLAISTNISSKPKILFANINTTAKQKNETVKPLLRVDIYNPTGKSIKGKLIAEVGGTLKEEVKIALDGHSSKEYNVVLPPVPQDFSFANFSWEVKLVTDQGEDKITDQVDVERSMLTAFKYLIKAQKFYPDGRYSNHYFGDAYGVRAMFAYLDYLEKNPNRLNENKDIWATISTEDIKQSATWFYDMLAERQIANGAYPMGYSEHTQGYNVADGGQIGLAIGQSMRYIKDPQQRQRYINSLIKFGDWAESFYIDSLLSEELRVKRPKEAKRGEAAPGFYGLGQNRFGRIRTGPSWVLADIIGAQIALSHLTSGSVKSRFEDIAKRNSEYYTKRKFNAKGYYQAEALFWIYFDTDNEELKKIIRKNLASTFLKPLYEGTENDMYEIGSRVTLKAMPLLYYRNHIADDADMRAVLLKYIWSFGSESSTNSMKYLAKALPKPVHGESLTVAKYAALSSLWAIELLYPNSTIFVKN